MSESIAIPKRKGKQRLVTSADSSASSEASPLSSTASSIFAGNSYSALSTPDKPSAPQSAGKKSDNETATSSKPSHWTHERRTSWLSSSISKSEHMTLNIGNDERPRLITCVTASQGFDWNRDIFVPSYMSDRDHQAELERRQDPVEDIFVTDEEAEDLLLR